MRCWKTINVKKHYGLSRLFLLSSILMIAVFIVSYIGFELTRESGKTDAFFALFLTGVILLYPAHKMLHFAALWKYRKRITLVINRDWSFFPLFLLRIREPIPKKRFALSLVAPFFILNPLFVAGGILFPVFSHYFTALLAFHCGICLIDFVYVKNLSRSPKSSYIEENDDGYEILVPLPE
ncbi:DUF3267 domain-containing protein [Bhargavaea beijingensis]|uniref:DUF3267 domain-containing protein n=1 Tax=Bhargavaea beijingensis TaxID=426756 RepID=A0A1G7E292_9BACL|nr:DUF3267 domain-containing protein [Bhargavaea beijingensis]MCW1927470.1 DUF3267 domain-containing protein [Bhargavaea beijingensis]RSK34972.1 DUF3267 domain-containing protein [Bhargavaea beijingensis]SDE57606.1 Putative zincin peptidase [Bhargavaea beijingensis]